MPNINQTNGNRRSNTIYVYQAPMRLWHWVNAAAILVLCITGYVIGTPLASAVGDPSSLYVIGWVRFLHLACGYIFAAGWVFRLWWAVVGNHYARDLFIPRFWRRSWVDDLIHEIGWYLFLRRDARRCDGISSLPQLMMLVLFVAPSIILLLTGFAIYAEISGHVGTVYAMFGWMMAIFANSIDLHGLHRLAMWVMLNFILAHIYIVIRDDIVSPQSKVSTMISGFRQFKDDQD